MCFCQYQVFSFINNTIINIFSLFATIKISKNCIFCHFRALDNRHCTMASLKDTWLSISSGFVTVLLLMLSSCSGKPPTPYLNFAFFLFRYKPPTPHLNLIQSSQRAKSSSDTSAFCMQEKHFRDLKHLSLEEDNFLQTVNYKLHAHSGLGSSVGRVSAPRSGGTGFDNTSCSSLGTQDFRGRARTGRSGVSIM